MHHVPPSVSTHWEMEPRNLFNLANILYSVECDVILNLFTPPECCHVCWLPGLGLTSAPEYLMVFQSPRGLLDDADLPALILKIYDLGGGTGFIFRHKTPKAKTLNGRPNGPNSSDPVTWPRVKIDIWSLDLVHCLLTPHFLDYYSQLTYAKLFHFATNEILFGLGVYLPN